MRDDTAPSERLAVVGALLAALGTYVPWIVTAPGVDVVPAIYLAGMGWRVAGSDHVVLGVLVVGLAVAARYRHRRRGGLLAAATGGLVVVLTVVLLASSLDGFLGTFVPGPGAVVTVAGGLVLVVAGRRHPVEADRDST